jgi:hypothetical protein
LAQRLARKQSELEEARQAFDHRLADLTRQKEELQTQLRSLEAEIQAVGSAGAASAAGAPVRRRGRPPGTGKKAAAVPAPRLRAGQTLPRLLVDLVRAAGRPLTVKELTAEVRRAKFRTASRNLPKMVHNKVGELVKRGLLRRAEGQAGVVLGQPVVGQAAANGRKASTPAAPARAAAAPIKLTEQSKGSLRVLLAQLLARSDRPMSARELADQAIQAGYRTNSSDFINVIWDAMSKIPGVENVRGQGYRMKKRGPRAK